MKLPFYYFKLFFLGTVRNIPALFFTLIFPPLMLILFSHHWDSKNSSEAVIVFFNYSVQTVALMLLGMGVTQEKNSDWAKYLRTMPIGIQPMLIGRLLHTLILSLINLITLSIVAVFILQLSITFNHLVYFALIALAGAIPMSIFGITIGFLASPESSRSIFTLLNILLLFGAFSLPSEGVFSIIRECIPTYQWSQLSYAYVDKNLNPLIPLLWLIGYSIFFIILFKIVYKKSIKKM